MIRQTTQFKIFRAGAVLLVLTASHLLPAHGNEPTSGIGVLSGDCQLSRPESNCAAEKPAVAGVDENIPVYTYEVVNSWPHDPDAFTQGLVFYDGKLYESTGHYGSSTLRKIDLRKGEILKKIAVAPQYFAEGITVFQGKLFQLTWSEHKALVYDLKGFRLERELSYEGEGWGLTHDGHQLIMSNGTNQIRFVDPTSLMTIRTINVFDNGAPLLNLNELEYIKDEIWANIWKSDRIVRIDPQNGRVLGWIDLAGLRPPAYMTSSENVLNGIAYDEKEDRILVTGKRWPRIFEIRVKPRTTTLPSQSS